MMTARLLKSWLLQTHDKKMRLSGKECSPGNISRSGQSRWRPEDINESTWLHINEAARAAGRQRQMEKYSARRHQPLFWKTALDDEC